jgi:hypothetical protein
MYLDIFLLNIGEGTPSMTHIQKKKVKVDSICASIYEPGRFYLAHERNLAIAEISLATDPHLSIAQSRIKYS